MLQFNLLPWRAQAQQRTRRRLSLFVMIWILLLALWLVQQLMVVRQQQTQLQQLQQSIQRAQPAIPNTRTAWQQAPGFDLEQVNQFWALLAEVTPPEVTLQRVQATPDAVLFNGTARHMAALTQLLTALAAQPSIGSPQWRSWVSEDQVHFEWAAAWERL